MDDSSIPSYVPPAPEAYSPIPSPRLTEETSKAKSEAESPPTPPVPEKVTDAANTTSGAAGHAREG